MRGCVIIATWARHYTLEQNSPYLPVIARIEDHPPGEKAMHDFENVVSFQLEQRPRRGARPISPPPKARSAPTQQPACPAKKKIAACSKENEDPELLDEHTVTVLPSHDPAVNPVDLCNPGAAPSPSKPGELPAMGDKGTNNETKIFSDVSGTVPCQQEEGASPAIDPHIVENTPINVEHQQRQHGCNATPASVLTTANRLPTALVDGQFQPTPILPTPATVRGTTSAVPAAKVVNATAPQRESGFRSPPPRTIFSKKRRGEVGTKAHAPVESPPAIPEDRMKSPRCSLARPVQRFEVPPADLPPTAGAAAALPGAEKRTQSVVLPSATNKGNELELITIDLGRYGKGPVPKRPPTCPPLFKLDPVVDPSPWKAEQIASIGAQFFAQERELLGALTSSGKRPHGEVRPSADNPGEISGMPNATQGLGGALDWACGQLKQQPLY